MNLSHLRYFFEVAKQKSYTKAAHALRISQPALSKQIAQLESGLGHQLLVRGRNGISLTPAGLSAWESAERIFGEVRNLELNLRSGPPEYSGSFCCGISDNLALHVFSKTVIKFRERHPRLRLQVFVGTSSDIKREMLSAKCEVGVFYTPVKKSEPFRSQILREVEFVLVSSPTALQRHGIHSRSPTVKDLKRKHVPRIESRHSDYAGGFPAHFHSLKLGLTEAPWIEVNQHEVKKKFVMEGAGFAILTRPTVARELEDGRLVQIRTPAPLFSPVFWVLPKNRQESAVQAQFRLALQSTETLIEGGSGTSIG